MTERFDIKARAEGDATKDQMRLMMRSLLAERFNLAVHTETRQVPVLALIPARPGKTGPRLRPHSEDLPCPANTPGIPITETTDGFPALCVGLLELPPSLPGRLRMGARRVTMEFVANALGSLEDLGRPVMDQTRLNGTFDFTIEWTRDTQGDPPASASLPIDASGPELREAISEQLGLKLESRTGPVSVIILDRVEHPSGN
jgi:uncharacterized protein (TIGR03435 family)